MKINLFCFPFLGASGTVYYHWKKIIKSSHLILLEYPGHGHKIKDALCFEFNNLVDLLYIEIKDQLNEPYIFYGHSMGALVSYELIKKLIKNDDPLPKRFILSGHRAPHIQRPERKMNNLSEEEFIKRFQESYDSLPQALLNDKDSRKLFIPILQADISVIESYNYQADKQVLPCPITAFSGTLDRHADYNDVKQWENYTNEFELFLVPADHYSIVKNDALPLRIEKVINKNQ